MCDTFSRIFDVQTSCKPSNYVLGLMFVVNIKFPRATYEHAPSVTFAGAGPDSPYFVVDLGISIILNAEPDILSGTEISNQ